MWMNYIYAIWRWKKQCRCFEIIAQRFQQKHVNYNLVFFRDEIEIFIISLFETWSRFVPSISRASRRDRDLYLLYLVLRDEIENLLYQILNFEKGTRNKKGFLVIEREFSSLILTRFFEIENSRQCLIQRPKCWLTKSPSAAARESRWRRQTFPVVFRQPQMPKTSR